MPKVLLINEMDREFVDKFNGREIRIPPGKAAKVQDYVAYHFIGIPSVINGENANDAAAEKKRVAMRYGAFKPEDRDVKIPKLRIEAIEEDEIKIVEVKPKAKKAEVEEPEFPSLQEAKEKDPFREYKTPEGNTEKNKTKK